MASPGLSEINAGEIRHFCATVQVCAVIVAVMASARTPSAFLLDLAGFTLLLQGTVAVSGGCWYLFRASSRVGRARFRRLSSARLGMMGSALPPALASLAASVGIFTVCGHYLPGTAGVLPVAAQVFGSAAVLSLSLYTVSLRRRNRRLQHSEIEATGYLLTQRLRHHFLFNALNTTVGLVRRHPDVAMRTLEDLSELFRAMLKQKPTTTLAQEIEFVRRYICIERVRLGARLGVEWRVPGSECLDMRVPAMLIQPLVENAVYHGIEPREEGGIIRIEIELRGGRVFFDIRNPVGDAESMPFVKGNRMAQKSVRERLVRAYGAACRFKSEQRRGEYRVAFSIPQEKVR